MAGALAGVLVGQEVGRAEASVQVASNERVVAALAELRARVESLAVARCVVNYDLNLGVEPVPRPQVRPAVTAGPAGVVLAGPPADAP